MQQDCGEMPLWIRRKKLLLKFPVKVASNPTNPASALAIMDWQEEWRKYEPGKEPLNYMLQQYGDNSGE